MNCSPRGRALIESFEGSKLDSYRDVAGIWTIGVGHTRNAHADQHITQQQADEFLAEDLQHVEDSLTGAITAPVNQNQFDACCSLAFNIGTGAFSSSTLLKKLNLLDYAGAQKEFSRWNRSGGQVVNGLITRRAAEAELFGEPMPTEVPTT